MICSLVFHHFLIIKYLNEPITGPAGPMLTHFCICTIICPNKCTQLHQNPADLDLWIQNFDKAMCIVHLL